MSKSHSLGECRDWSAGVTASVVLARQLLRAEYKAIFASVSAFCVAYRQSKFHMRLLTFPSYNFIDVSDTRKQRVN